MSTTTKEWDEGMKMLDAVYGPGYSNMMTGLDSSAYVSELVCNQFGKLWASETLSIREKRLMVLGATAMLGRADLIETQIGGALANGEFTDAQLDHIPHFLLFYVGAGNSTALFRGIQAARAKAKAAAESTT